jgi:dienelactone hydrolase
MDIVTPLLHWEMYGPGTSVSLQGSRQGDAFELTVKRGDTSILTTRVDDSSTLLRRSTAFREWLQQQGYATHPPMRTLGGGLCWGPETPLGISMLAALQA